MPESGLDEAIKIIRTLLKKRTGRSWSVRRENGSSYGWITIMAPPRRCTADFGYLNAEDQATLAAIFGECHHQGIMIHTGNGVRAKYACQAAGVELPAHVRVAQPDWD